MSYLEQLGQADTAARSLSQHLYQGCPSWCVELRYSKTFENGGLTAQSERLEVVAVTGGISSIRLSLEEAIAAASSVDPEFEGEEPATPPPQ